MLVVLALGAKALARPGDTGPRGPCGAAAEAIATVARRHTVVVSCGVGVPAQHLEPAVRNQLPSTECATLLTQVVVDDVARPLTVVQLRTIELLARAGTLAICAGSDGSALALDDGVALRPVDSRVDNDLVATLLAAELNADALALLTDVEGAFLHWGTPAGKVVRRAHPDRLDRSGFAPSSMGAKVEAACDFATTTGNRACIGSIEDAGTLLGGAAGTTIALDVHGVELEPPRA